MNRHVQHLARVAGAFAAGAVLVTAGAAPAFADASSRGGPSDHRGRLDVTPFARTSTCPTEVDATHPLCRVVSWTTSNQHGTTWAYFELTTEQYDPDPNDNDGKTYLSDIQCNGPVRAQRRHGVITLDGRFAHCDVGTGTEPAGPYRIRGTLVESGPTATTRVNHREYRYSLFAAVL